VRAEKFVGRFQSPDSAQSQLLGQSPLPGGEAAFRSSGPAPFRALRRPSTEGCASSSPSRRAVDERTGAE
jgi:hypothetical protein